MIPVHICRKCGSDTEFKRINSTQGWFCKKCDWSIVTSYIPEFKNDSTIYSIYLVNVDYKNTKHIKVISKISGMNFLETRKFLSRGESLIYKGIAEDILKTKEFLNIANIEYNIKPNFKY